MTGLSRKRDLNLKNVVNNGGITYVVSTCDTYDRGFETMVFISKYQPDTNDMSKINFDLIDYSDIYQNVYSTEKEARKGHEATVNRIINFKASEDKKLAYDNKPTPVTFEEYFVTVQAGLNELLGRDE